jgi:hypothetical protein
MIRDLMICDPMLCNPIKRAIPLLGFLCLALVGLGTAAVSQTPPAGSAPATPPAPTAAAPAAPAPPPCAAPEFHQLDFWVGDWNLTHRARTARDKDEWTDGTGTNSVRKILKGCVIEEHFEDKAGDFMGQSASVYDPAQHQWRQTWVDDSAGYLVLRGNFENGRMVLQTPVEKNATKRMVFHDIKPDSFDWDWESSTDAGKTWVTMWKIHYARRK